MAETKGCIGIIPLGNVPMEVLEAIAVEVPAHIGPPARVLSPMENPSYAYNRRRLQYNAAHIIQRMEVRAHLGYRKVLGVLNVDLFLPIFTHVFGEAREGGECALVSLYRLKRNVEGLEVSMELVAERAAKVALHEIAHLFNVAHCMDRNCLMHFSMDLQELDETPMEFCFYCRAYLSEGFRHDR
jgi:archaemetzincin